MASLDEWLRPFGKIQPRESAVGQNHGSAHFSNCAVFPAQQPATGHPDIPAWVSLGGSSGTSLSGGIAQLVERQLCKLDVRGSNPLASKEVFKFKELSFKILDLLSAHQLCKL
jgi:hypothetical protein